ncbi:glycosyltransferase family 2 protein [Colwellia sp. BRX8-7]|uniref:glycosyltransferase family 2 protein n=1 Tax=Colwellia sp. BRX8-7 TaxID=2759833 RepID=UPI0015F36B58|nr:glycosyltransferase family 2 protein [Colwellia sp. BRX8-7]MBA6336414.1 glycosyltransferase family 2 protein [Colwellia sp. BRX8-7]
MIFLESLLLLSIFLVFYTYLFYPIILMILSGARQIVKDTSFVLSKEERRTRSVELPEVTVIIAAYNEEKCIEDRIINLLNLNYPKDKLRFIIGSDGSTDNTNSILSKFDEPNLDIFCFDKNRGKINVLNELMTNVSSPICVFSDANTMFDKDALEHLVTHFESQKIGAVCGELHLIDPFSGDNKDNLYWKYEQALKFHESRLNALLGANGAIYAIRTDMYIPLPTDTIIDDFCIVMNIAQKGYSVIYAPEAKAIEEIAPDLAEESSRRIRIGAGNYQAMMRLGWLLNPMEGYRFFSYVSHKVLRWFVPHLMVIILTLNAILATNEEFYRYLLLLQVIFYSAAIVGMKMKSGSGLIFKVLQLLAFFVSMNFSLLRGFIKFLNKNLSATWESTSR